MKCKNCSNFRKSDRVEFGKSDMVEFGNEISPEMKSARGTCRINNARCRADDECRYGNFTPK